MVPGGDCTQWLVCGEMEWDGEGVEDADVQLKMTVSPMTASTRCGWKVVDALSAVSWPPTVMTMVVCAAASVHARSCKVLAN